MEPDAMILVFWMLNFKSAVSLSSFTLIKRLFSSSSYFSIRVVSYAYLRLLIFLQAISVLVYESSDLTFHMMYSAQKLYKQDDNIILDIDILNFEPVFCSMSSSNCCFLSCIQVSQDAGKVVRYFHLFKYIPLFVVIHPKVLA